MLCTEELYVDSANMSILVMVLVSICICMFVIRMNDAVSASASASFSSIFVLATKKYGKEGCQVSRIDCLSTYHFFLVPN